MLGLMQGALGLPIVWWTSFWRHDGKIGIPSGLRGLLVRRILKVCRAVATYSETAATVAARAGVDRNRIFIAYNSLDTELLEQIECDWRTRPNDLRSFRQRLDLEGRQVALYVGRLIKEKRLRTLLDAWSLVLDRKWSTLPRLLIVGDGEERPRIEEYVDESNLSETVKLVGEIRGYAEVCPYFLVSRAFVLPGTGGLGINHALTHGVPAVVVGGDGTEQDVIEDDRNGFLVPTGDIHILADRVSRLLTASSVEWTTMSECARRVVRERASVRHMIAGLASAVRFAAGAGVRPEEWEGKLVPGRSTQAEPANPEYIIANR